MEKEELKLRIKVFALNIIKLINSLPNTKDANLIAYQVMKSVTSLGANYRAALRGRSHTEFISKIDIVE